MQFSLDLSAGFTEKDFSPDELARISRVAAGRTVHFPARSNGESRLPDPEAVLERYARGATARALAEELNASERWIYKVLSQERGRCSSIRVRHWRSCGLSYRQIGRLCRRSHEACRQMAEDAGLDSADRQTGETAG